MKAFTVLIVSIIIYVLGGIFLLYLENSYPGPNGYGSRTTSEEILEKMDLHGKVILVTGSTSGIGKTTAGLLAQHGAEVIVHCRSEDQVKETFQSILEEYKIPADRLTPFICDLGSLKSIKSAVMNWLSLNQRLDILINNAGVMGFPKRTETEDGLEMHMGVNHIGHFYLTKLLLPKLLESKPSRIINVSSRAHQMANISFITNKSLESYDYDSWRAYGNSKLANIIHALELNERYQSEGVTAYSVHPGVIWTNLAKHFDLKSLIYSISYLPVFKSHSQGSATTLYAALRAPLNESGLYFEDCNVRTLVQNLSSIVQDSEIRKKFWDISETLITETK